jgi:virginiamycin B lyase
MERGMRKSILKRMGKKSIIVASMGLLCNSLPTVTDALIIGEYSILPAYTVSGIESGLASGPNGDIWFTDRVNDKIVRVTRSGNVSVFALPPFGQLTGSITSGPDGNIWATKAFNGRILRITPEGVVTEFSVGMDSPGRITAGPDGNLWFTASNLIGQMTTDGELATFSLPTANVTPTGITTGPDGNLWFAETGADQIGRITTDGIITEFPIPTPSAQPVSITSGPDGNLWFTESGKIGRISPDGVITEFPIPTANSYVYGITSGPDGNLWFAVNSRDKIGRITTSGVFLVELSTPSAFSGPQQITAGPDGLIWFTESSTNKIGIISLADVSTYFPLTSGNSWTYQKNGVGGFTRTVSAGIYSINGVSTKLIQYSDGYQAYYTNDSNGVREHREYDPSTATTVTLSPPLIFANSQSKLGFPLGSSGTASGTQGGYPFSFSYSCNSTPEALDFITVPAGKFWAVRIYTSVELGGVLSTQTNWVADGLGAVKTVEGGNTYLMASTNIVRTTPDPFWFNEIFGSEPNTVITSNAVAITGITRPASISITGGEYRIDAGSYTTISGTVSNGETVTVRQISSNSFSNKTFAILTIGGMSTQFGVTTRSGPTAEDLAQVITVLKILSGMQVTMEITDINGDGKIGTEEAIFLLQKAARLRP